MGQRLRGSATTPEAVRRVMRRSQESVGSLARRHSISPSPSGRGAGARPRRIRRWGPGRPARPGSPSGRRGRHRGPHCRRWMTQERNHHAPTLRPHDELHARFQLFLDAYDPVRRLMGLCGLTSHEAICRAWSEETDRFRVGPARHPPGLTTWSATRPHSEIDLGHRRRSQTIPRGEGQRKRRANPQALRLSADGMWPWPSAMAC